MGALGMCGFDPEQRDVSMHLRESNVGDGPNDAAFLCWCTGNIRRSMCQQTVKNVSIHYLFLLQMRKALFDVGMCMGMVWMGLIDPATYSGPVEEGTSLTLPKPFHCFSWIGTFL